MLSLPAPATALFRFFEDERLDYCVLGAVTAAGIGFRGGPGIPWSGMHDHKQ